MFVMDYYAVVLVLLIGSSCSSPVTIEEFFGCSKIGCTPDQYCIRDITGNSRCSDKAVCGAETSCPRDKVCNIRLFPCPHSNCPYIETCEYSCSAVTCDAGKSCVIKDDGPHCIGDNPNDVCELYKCEESLHCLALKKDECLRLSDNCPWEPVCVDPADVCLNYQCSNEYKCVESREHCLVEECIPRPVCVYDGHPCDVVECEQGYVCVENTPKDCGEHCLRQYKCVDEDAPCELYECEAGKVCQESRNHCIDIRVLDDGNDECQAVPECVSIDDPCDQYTCLEGYHCQSDRSHCQEDVLQCQPWAVCVKHVETCDDKQCTNDTVCEMQAATDCHTHPCPDVPVCVEKQRQGRLLKNFLTNLKLAKESKFQKIIHEGKLGIFINESSILGLLNDLKEKIKNKTQEIIEAPTKLPEDVDTLVSLLAKPKPGFLTSKKPLTPPSRPDFPPNRPLLPSPFRPELTPGFSLPTPVVHSNLIPNRRPSQSHRPFRVTPSNSVIYYKGFRPNKKVLTMPDPVPQGGHRRPLFKKPPSMSVYTPRYNYRAYAGLPAGRSRVDSGWVDNETPFNETEGYQNNTNYEQETNAVPYADSVVVSEEEDPNYMIITSSSPEGRTGEEIQYNVTCGMDGAEIEILSDSSFSGNISYLEGMDTLCSTETLTNQSVFIIHVPYQYNCGDNMDNFNLQHYVQLDWDDDVSEVLPLHCYLESRSRHEAAVSIDPYKTKSILDIQQATQQALLIFDQFGQPVKGHVRLGETVQLFFTVGMTNQHTFDADLMNCYATSDDGSARELIINDGCPINTEKIQGPIKEYIPNRMNKYNTYDIKYIVKTHPIKGSLNVKYSCDVRVCMPECITKIYCGKDQRVRREEPNSEARIMMNVETESMHLNL